MVQTTPFFWTDAEQAQQRLQNSFVLFDDEPVNVVQIAAGPRGGAPTARLYGRNDQESTQRLDDARFGRFRQLPRLGWMNLREKVKKPTGLFLERIVRNTRTHGLNNDNVMVMNFIDGHDKELSPGRHSFSDIALTDSFLECHRNVYPSLPAILEGIEERQGLAYSRNYLVYCDKMGLRWLFRRKECIGLFTGMDTLNLFQKASFYREEIMEDPLFTLNNIREL